MAKGELNSVEAALEGIKGLLLSLPGEGQKHDYLETLSQTTRLLEGIRQSLAQMPTREEVAAAAIVPGLERLAGFLRGSAASPKRRAARAAKTVDMGKIADLVARLQSAPEAEIRPMIRAAKLTKDELAAAVRHAGGLVSSRATKTLLEEQLAQTIINQRTLDGLRGGATP